MKKFLSIVLAVILILSMSIHALAAETDFEQRELIELACDIFPEYEEKIRTQEVSIPNARSLHKRELVTTETRTVSENESLIYSEYSDGIILLTDYTYEPASPTVTIVDELDTSTYSHVTVNIKATCSNVSGYFLLEDAQYRINYNGYDCITDEGTPTYSGKCSLHTYYNPIWNETSSGNAQICYRLNFLFGPGGYYTLNSLLTLSVGNNKATATHVDYT